jgi:ribonuclease J
MHEGVVIVALDDQLNPMIDSLGLPLDEDYEDFVAEARQDIVTAIKRLKGKGGQSASEVHEAARLAARRAAQRWSGKRPQVRVLLPTRLG